MQHQRKLCHRVCLFEAVDSLPGFKYYSYLLNHPNVAHGFVDAPLLYKLSMVTEFINANM
jgi:hypothetical protein